MAAHTLTQEWDENYRVESTSTFSLLSTYYRKKKKVEEGMLVLSLVSVSTHLSVALRPKTTI